MTGWQPIETAPRDGTPILLRGGKDKAYGSKTLPAVVAFHDTDFREDQWCYAYWDDDWYSIYSDPTEWHPIPE